MRRLPNLNAARAFECAARHESFVGAAAELGITEAAISRHVRILEAELGTILFARGHRSITLTAEGRAYAERLSEGLAIIAGRSRAGSVQRRNRVVLDIDSDLAATWLLPRLSLAALDAMQIELDVRSRLDWPRQLPSDTDLAIVWGGYESAGFRSSPFLKATAFIVSAPVLEASVPPPDDPTRYANHCLLHERTDAWWRKVFSTAGLGSVTATRNVYFHRTYLVANAAACGLGLAVGDDIIFAEGLKTGRLIRLPGPSLPGSRMFFLLEPSGRRLSSSVKNLRDWLIAEAAAHRTWQTAFSEP